MKLDLKEGSFIASLTTTGRKSGREHTVPLRLVFYGGKLYASRKNPDGDWLKNIARNPSVAIELQGLRVDGTARLVDDEELSRKISQLKYSDERSNLQRIVVEITPKM